VRVILKNVAWVAGIAALLYFVVWMNRAFYTSLHESLHEDMPACECDHSAAPGPKVR